MLPIALGSAVYLLWRSPRLRVFRWMEAASLDGALASARAVVAGIRLPGWMLFSLPDALWVYAFVACMALIWRGKPVRQAAFWIALGPALSLGSELAQLAGIVPGTFDPADFWLGALASAIPLHLLYLRECSRHATPSLSLPSQPSPRWRPGAPTAPGTAAPPRP
ncbi:hypothetical protein [Longimicrobium sp.]|uniref:hypothetical protein n=1 Tax=Longimicrobium sp. TaxID=2029185 RepID=UPI002CB14F81|nr:hypothetical protein [Longimicrobium sp.]HSU14625.1 hypothetical protein [Longimicrobium sp.]